MAPTKGYRLGEFASLTGLTPDTLRFYERRGLLEAPARSEGRFRIYTAPTVDRIHFIKRAQTLGFSLDEIHELVHFNGQGGLQLCCRVRELLTGRLRDLETKLAELSGLRETLKTTLDQCKRAIDTENESACPVIEFGAGRRKDGAM